MQNKTVVYAESDSDEPDAEYDSDYEQHPRPPWNTNIGLKEPSQSRICSQALITTSHSIKQHDDFPVRATDESKDKKCQNVSGINNNETTGGNIPILEPPHDSSSLFLDSSSTSSGASVESSRTLSSLGSGKTEVKPKPQLSPLKTSNIQFHKHRPKNPGKHLRPVPVSSDQKVCPPQTLKKQKSEFVTITHGLKRPKKVQKYWCKLCSVTTESQAAANKHYKLNHPPISCAECTRVFNNPNLLRHHKYSHSNPTQYPCRSCDKTFPFESDLTSHRLTHRRNPGYICNNEKDSKICGWWFFAKSDLTKHAKTHAGIVYSCYECPYTTIDVRYLRAHRYTHSDKERYFCKKCQKKFKHHTQMIRHREHYI